MMRRIAQNLIVLLSLSLISTSLLAADISDIIGQNIKGTQILDVKILTIPNDDGLMLVVKTSAGERKFIVTKENIVAALAILQNPEAYGANNAMLLNRTILHLPSAQPLVLAKNPPNSPITPTPSVTTKPTPMTAATPVATQTTIERPSPASAIVSSMVLSSNQQASK